MKKLFTFALASLLALAIPASATNEETNRNGLADDLIYFVFADRYLNGKTSNDLAGGVGNDPTGGYRADHTAFFHGGDFAGLTGSCAPGDNGLHRIKALGFTAVWLTPIVEQTPATSDGAGYHGYWGAKFDNTDPHFGTKAEFKALTDCAKKLGLKVILDIVTNHTGDIIQYDNRQPYLPAGFENAKSPAWLNNIANYNNVGPLSNCWGEGDCQRIGDFFTLDDLKTENPAVYQGWGEVYGDWIAQYGLAGFRVDTAKHLDPQFFANWNPIIFNRAKKAGLNDFTIFGEVWDTNPANLMRYIREENIPTVLDFPFQQAAIQFASGLENGDVLKRLFLADDYYNTATNSANNLVTFLGNHDMGRVGHLLYTARYQSDNEALKRVKLAHDLLYLSRGIPTVYYGDEVGMTGTGNGRDQLARQNMFATKVNFWKDEPRIGSKPIGNADSFSNSATHPLVKHLQKLSSLRNQHPGLGNHQLQLRVANRAVTVISKRETTQNLEYLVGFNNTKKARTITIKTSTKDAKWFSVYGKTKTKVSANEVTFNIPALSTIVLKADRSPSFTEIKISSLKLAKDLGTGYFQLTAELETLDLAEVKFYSRINKSGIWQLIGTDRNAPYIQFVAAANAEQLQYKAVAIASSGNSVEQTLDISNN